MQLRFIFFLTICLPSILQAQDITGLWTGYLSTTDKTLPYEVVISKRNGVLVAYSHTTFTVNGKDITSVKKLKPTYEMRHLSLEDEDLLKNNFEKAAPKKISQTTELDLRMNGKQMILEGSFKTKRTRTLRPAEGVIILYKSIDPVNAQSRIQSDLQELKLDDALVVFKPLPPVDVAINEPIKQPTGPSTSTSNIAVKPVPNKATTATVPKQTTTSKSPSSAVVSPKPTVAASKPPVAKPTTVLPPIIATASPSLPKLPAIDLSNRKIEVIDDITVFGDSLVFNIYDNGEVDGDTVSVVLNGKTIISKQRLGTRALTQTVYLTPDLGDTLQIVMYAENMGLYPPNTGLLIIQDGSHRREVRFSGDLNKNAAIMLRRNKR